MKRIRIVGLCLVAVFALSAVAATGASAETLEFKTCVKAKPKESGKFNDKACSVASKGGKKEGDYELGAWNAGKTTKFTGKNGVSTLDSYIPSSEAEPWAGGTVVGEVTCKNSKSAGIGTGPKTEEVTVTFAACSTEGKKCTSDQKGEKIGDITTNPLTATLVWGAESANPEVLIESKAGKEAASAEFNCEGLKVATVRSPVLGVPSGNINKISKESKQAFKVTETGGQEQVFYSATYKGALEEPAFLASFIEPPGVVLPSGENTSSTLKGEAEEIAVEP